MKDFFKQHPVYFALLNIAVVGIIGLLILLIVHFSLLKVTHHGEEVEVPDLSGMYIDEAQMVLEASELKFLVIDSTYDRSKRLGTVIQQVPVAGAHVKKNREIYLSINAKQVRKVLVPDVLEMSYREARASMISVGLKVDTTYKESEYKDLVLDIEFKKSSIEPLTPLSEGEIVTLVLGKGRDSSDDYDMVVPNLIGLSLDVARNTISNRGLQLGGCITDDGEIDTSSETYWVYDQEPRPRVATFAGATVSIYVSKDFDKAERMNLERQQQEAEKAAEEEFF